MTPAERERRARELLNNWTDGEPYLFIHDKSTVELFAQALLDAEREGMEAAADIAKDFSWQLPVYGRQDIDEATDDCACAVSDQIEKAIRASAQRLGEK